MNGASLAWATAPNGPEPSAKYTEIVETISGILVRMRRAPIKDVAVEILKVLISEHEMRYRNNPHWAGSDEEPSSYYCQVLVNLENHLSTIMIEGNEQEAARTILFALAYGNRLKPAVKDLPVHTGDPVEKMQLRELSYFVLSRDEDRSLSKFDKLVYDVLGQEIDWISQLEASRTSYFSFTVVPIDGMQNKIEYQREWFNQWLSGTLELNLGMEIPMMVLNHMCYLGYIPAGRYLIDTSW